MVVAEANIGSRRRVAKRKPPPGILGRKAPFDIDEVIRLLRMAVAPYPKAAMFDLRDQGFPTLFQQLTGCIISIRTLDEISLQSSLNLLKVADSPKAVAKLSVGEIDKLIYPCTFHRAKAETIHQLACESLERFGGELPEDYEQLTSLKGVGPKCASLALGIACNMGRIAVDIHVHRVTNRWGYVEASSPEKTMIQLEGVLPAKYWIEINSLLVPFGKHICTGARPRCSTCPLHSMCRQVGVRNPR